ncbi:hypothetical protein MAPG_07302 [Magnaporthiopsis poae ATCC 64411]|uniref:Uncharacterized protein n=1 Tax=Magnaporthiopsis poae (strain ATCC 64411 / 73-15) TaxID=644358 RepID=A0A0C4E4B0_MAGP6|nr:hypothetical protein MAPG_07302 [Magnaporthiopsis poae ATCC 64411]
MIRFPASGTVELADGGGNVHALLTDTGIHLYFLDISCPRTSDIAAMSDDSLVWTGVNLPALLCVAFARSIPLGVFTETEVPTRLGNLDSFRSKPRVFAFFLPLSLPPSAYHVASASILRLVTHILHKRSALHPARARAIHRSGSGSQTGVDPNRLRGWLSDPTPGTYEGCERARGRLFTNRILACFCRAWPVPAAPTWVRRAKSTGAEVGRAPCPSGLAKRGRS